jgi:hypothetical protein
MNLAVVGDESLAEGASARAAFARQQRAYEQVQTNTDVYADRLAISGGPELDLGEIDAYFQLRGDTPALVSGIVDHLSANRRWSRLHLALRAFFPGEELDKVRRRIRYLGEAVLPEVRRAIAADPGTTVGPVGTTVGPVGTTVGPVGTTVGPVGTTVGPVGTTVEPGGTTVGPVGTTIEPGGTT